MDKNKYFFPDEQKLIEAESREEAEKLLKNEDMTIPQVEEININSEENV